MKISISIRFLPILIVGFLLSACMTNAPKIDHEIAEAIDEMEELFELNCQINYGYEVGSPDFSRCVSLERKIFYGEVEQNLKIVDLEKRISRQEKLARIRDEKLEDERIRESLEPLCPKYSSRAVCN